MAQDNHGSAIVVGAGMGGLSAAIRLAQCGWRVQVLEARGTAGGLVSRQRREGLDFDVGPYVLLDRPGLEWVFLQLGQSLEEQVRLRRILQVYEVRLPDDGAVRIDDSLDETACGLDRAWPGAGARYRGFVGAMGRVYRRLQPLQRLARPGIADLLRLGAWRDVPLLLRTLGSLLKRTELPGAVCDTLGIWTHVAGQRVDRAPSPLGFVPAMIHDFGAWYPRGGIAAVANALVWMAERAGVEFLYRTKVRAIRQEQGRVVGVETEAGECLSADAVVANAAGLSVYLELLPAVQQRVRRRLQRLPLQSPGVCAYLAVRRPPEPPYLRFFLPGGDEPCRLLVSPGLLDPALARDGWWPARLMAPMDHVRAQAGGPEGQREFLQQVLAEPWWREHTGENRVLEMQVPAGWGAEHFLYRDSMNPVMTAAFMRSGRLAHRSPHVRGLYLCGSATHPGQWVSFCAISGILAADLLCEDRG